jgi:hypothetical protein
MIQDIIEVYRIGKELGLSKKEISSLFFFENSKHRTMSTVLFIFLVVLTLTTLAVLILFAYIQIERNTYPTGTKYSTVRIKDFRLKVSNDQKILKN